MNMKMSDPTHVFYGTIFMPWNLMFYFIQIQKKIVLHFSPELLLGVSSLPLANHAYINEKYCEQNNLTGQAKHPLFVYIS